MINSLSIEIYCANIVYICIYNLYTYIYIYKVQLIPYFICCHNSNFSMHSYHLPNII